MANPASSPTEMTLESGEASLTDAWAHFPTDYDDEDAETRTDALSRRSWLIHRRIQALAATRPRAVALTYADRSLTYGELEARANRLAHYLAARGVVHGSRVAVCVNPSFDISVALLASFKLGAIHVPLDPSYPRERLATILADTEPAAVLVHGEHLPRLPLARDSEIVTLDRPPLELTTAPSSPPDVDVRPEDVAYLIYTSGTTGTPKGVMTTHANLQHFVQVAVDRYQLCADDVVPAMARFTFSITMFEMFLPLVVGGRLLLLDRDRILDFPRLLPALRDCTLVHASPSLLRKLLAYMREAGISGDVLPQLRHLSSGGDFVSADLLEALKEKFPRVELFVIYGCTEISCMGCTFAVPRDVTLERSKVGKPFPDVSVHLLDEAGRPVADGEIGEVFFGGAGVTAGYFARPELTLERYPLLHGERLYRTGDLGRRDEDGNVELLGRSDFQVKLRGMRIELGDVEAALRRAPGIRDAVATAYEAEGREKVLVAYVVADASTEISRVREYLQSQLPDYMVPAAYVSLPALPVNMNQKLDRRALPPPTEADFTHHLTLVPPSTPTEARLLRLWQSVLGTDVVGVRDNFFDAGGDSLMSLPLMMAIEAEFGVALPMTLLLTHPTVEAIARWLDGPRDAMRPPLVTLRPATGDETEPPLFLVHDGEGECIPYRLLAKNLSGRRAVYGLQPHGRASFPMMHTRLLDVAKHYADVVEERQPQGPYTLGGLCIGGFIALETARILQARGHAVELVALIDVAHVTLPPKSLMSRRAKRFGDALKESAGMSVADRTRHVLGLLRRRALNVAKYEAVSRVEKARNVLRMRLFRALLDLDLPLPKVVQNIPVRVVLRFAEREYVIPEPYDGKVVLIRATRKDGSFDGTVVDDTPYVDLFDDPMLGWSDKTTQPVRVYDVGGGHSSMLQEPNVLEVARIIEAHSSAQPPIRSVP